MSFALPKTTLEYRLLKADGYHNLTLQEASIPKLKSTDVLVKVHAVALEYRDLIVAKGQYPFTQKENLVPGSDLAGEIIALGDEVNGWKIGDRVCSTFAVDHVSGDITEEIKLSFLGAPIDGVLTQYKILPAHCLVPIPEHLNYEEASTLTCSALTAYNALRGPIPLKGGDTVLVQGTGGVSTFALQLSVASGATVIATSSSDRKLDVARKLGAKHLINYKSTQDWDKEVLKITDGRGVDHVIEIGGSGTILRSLNAVRCGGCIHVIGFIAGQGDVGQLPLAILAKAAIVRGVLIGSRSQFEDLNRFISTVGLKPVIDKIFGFESLREAYEYLESQRHIGKVVVKVASTSGLTRTSVERSL